jgi:KDO2-lipid IV(A) lauroyltransferase
VYDISGKRYTAQPFCADLNHHVSEIKQTAFLHPRYWPDWLAVGLFRLIGRLPFDWQLSLGAAMGQIGYWLASNRRHIAETNIRLCFPEMPQNQQSELIKAIFRNNGRGIVETSFSWSGRIAELENRVEIAGLNHLQEASARGKGVLLIGMHFSTLDLCGAALAQKMPFDVMYRRNKNPLLEAIMRQGRIRNFPSAIERSDVRSVIRSLKAGHVVWYGPDQDYGRKHSVFAPFFGIAAASIKATARIVAMTDAAVVVFQHHRSEDNRYLIRLSEPLKNFPSGHEIADATRVNQLIENAVRQAPAQYWWVHRRFKTRPAGEARPY